MLVLLSALAAAAPPPSLAEGASEAAQAAYDWSSVARCGAEEGGRLTATLSVGGGAVRSVVVTEAAVDGDSLTCALGAISAWRFPAAVSGAVAVPLEFAPAAPPMTDAEAASVGRVLRRNAPQLQACYEQALRTDRSLEGTLSVLIWLDGGAVSASHVDGSLRDTPLAACLQRRLRAWAFPPSVSGELELPLAMAPAG